MKGFTPAHRGYCAVGLYHPKTPANVGSALRACQAFDAAMLVTQGRRYKVASTDTGKAWRHMPLVEADDLRPLVPYNCVPVAVELVEGSTSLVDYVHPERAFYVFGPEDGSLPGHVLEWCRDRVQIPSTMCLNLAATVNVVLYDRTAKRLAAGRAA